MMICETRCHLLVCDSCGTAFEHPDDRIATHYDTAEQARRDASEDRWSREEGLDRCLRCTWASLGGR